jgi:glycosyltransferase involved in cell wall biosynthesis
LRLLSEATISVDGKPVCVDWVGLPGPITSLPGILSLGRIGDLDTVLTGQTVLVAPLRSGTGISTKILEAMGRGVPVVATSTALRGIADPDGPVATICDPCPSSITAAVRAVLSDPEKARVVAARALRRTRLVFSRENAASALKLAVEGAQVGRPQSPEQMTARAA